MSDFEAAIPTAYDVHHLTQDVRPEDREEWLTAAGKAPRGAPDEVWLGALILGCIAQGPRWARVLRLNKVPLCMWGVSKLRLNVGLAWCIATNEGQRQALRAQRYFKQGIAEMHEAFPTLEAHAIDTNTVHHHWMERLGFVRGRPSELFGERFITFTRKA